MFTRIINISKSQSFFLLGARGTGKTTFLQQSFSNIDSHQIDLLSHVDLAALEARPSRLADIVAKQKKQWIIIDEIQKVPALLDEVHRLIESTGQKFVLTGSSARKLKRNASNMLAGRAFMFNLFTLTHVEIGDQFDLGDALSYGTLPKVFSFSSHRDKVLFLKAYAETYLKEEILVEQLIRKLPPFRRFLEIAASQDTKVTSFTNIGRDILVDPKIVSNYYSILEETLLGFSLQPYDTAIRKRQKRTPKFYWFDTGVRRALAGTVDDPARPQSFEYGSLFESFIVNEVFRLLKYAERSFRLSFLRIDEKMEIDLIIERNGMKTFLVEIKSTDMAHEGHVEALRKLSGSFKNSVSLLISRDPICKIIDGVHCLPWQQGIQEILAGTLS
ncbi:MAG: ATP-binding protein [Deltaproteobacteria bacterium]|nr:ATP-binding protein [Deltaproteobacteria bacterium]